MKLVLDTNVFVAAGFNPRSSSARILEAIRNGEIELVWDERTRAESRRIVRQIPPLHWDRFEDLFRPEDRFDGETGSGQFDIVADPDDRKFAALAFAAGAVLVSNDEHLLAVRDLLGVEVLTPKEAIGRLGV